jgi:hypothetical protein
VGLWPLSSPLTGQKRPLIPPRRVLSFRNSLWRAKGELRKFWNFWPGLARTESTQGLTLKNSHAATALSSFVTGTAGLSDFPLAHDATHGRRRAVAVLGHRRANQTQNHEESMSRRNICLGLSETFSAVNFIVARHSFGEFRWLTLQVECPELRWRHRIEVEIVQRVRAALEREGIIASQSRPSTQAPGPAPAA